MTEQTKEIWRFRLNWALTSFIVAVLYVSGIKDQFSSLHRYVTNPQPQNLNNTARFGVEPGLGESNTFYSGVMASIHFGAIFGGISMGFLVRILPYWYLFVCSICWFVLGSILYAASFVGWLLVLAELLIGFFKGAAMTLTYSYAVDSSEKYAIIQEEEDGTYKPIETNRAQKSAKVRDFLFALEGVGRGAGYIIGPATSVVLSYIANIDHLRSIGWVNMAQGLIVLILFVFLFRGESSCKEKYDKRHQCAHDVKESACIKKINKISVLIIITMHLLTYVVSTMWAYFETLLSPILSDSFGFNISLTAYVFLAFSIPKILGSLLVIVLQWMKISIQTIGIIGVSVTVAGYIAFTDWQTIPYDPCTEYSPYHNPNIVRNLTTTNQSVLANSQEAMMTGDFGLYGTIEFQFGNGLTHSVQVPLGVHGHCIKVPDCDCYPRRSSRDNLCLAYVSTNNSDILKSIPLGSLKEMEGYDTYKCSMYSHTTLCILKPKPHLQKSYRQAKISSVKTPHVLNAYQLSVVSNTCETANISNHKCHWIPYKVFQNNICKDCPPICRSTHKTVHLAQIIIGSALLLVGYSFVWFTALAISTNLTPKKFQGLIIGTLSATGTLSEALSPLFLVSIYEGAKKRLFPSTIAVAVFSLPFLLELILLRYWDIGSADQSQNDCEQSLESHCFRQIRTKQDSE